MVPKFTTAHFANFHGPISMTLIKIFSLVATTIGFFVATDYFNIWKAVQK